MLHLPDGDVVAPEYQELVRQLHQGDGLAWPGDPRLGLSIGVLHDRKANRTGRRLEVWRYNEDGSETMVAHWHLSEQHRVIYDLTRMRVDSPGHQSVLDGIDKHNDAMEQKALQQYRDSVGEATEHAARLYHDRNEPKNRFFMSDVKSGTPAD
jgi:hypothetical protein